MSNSYYSCAFTLLLSFLATAFMPTVGNLPPTSKKSKINLIVGISVGVGALIFLFVAAISYIVRRRRKKLQIGEDEDDGAFHYGMILLHYFF